MVDFRSNILYLEDIDKSKLLDKIQKGLERAVNAYSENYEYQAALQNIPVIGPFVDLMIKESSSKIGYRRLLNFTLF
jgi:hypothetical protein